MTATLNLFDHLLALGRRYEELGRTRDAVDTLDRLSGFRELPAATAEETQARLAEIQFKRRKFARARRHLVAALAHDADCARYHFLMGACVLAEDRSELARAAEHFRRALEIEPEEPHCLAEAGLTEVRLGATDEGLAKLHRAVELAGDDPDVIAKYVKALRLAGRSRDARQVLREALFRNPRVTRFRKLWREFGFQMLRQQQQSARRATRRNPSDDAEAVILPFIRIAASTEGETTPRPDGPPTVGRPRMPRRALPFDQRNVQ